MRRRGSFGLAACKSGGAQPSDFCKSLSSLNSTVSTINENPVTKSTVPAVKKSLKEINSSVKNLSDTAGSDFSSEVKAVQSGATDLGATVAAAVNRKTPATVTAARASMKSFTTDVKNLSDAATGRLLSLAPPRLRTVRRLGLNSCPEASDEDVSPVQQVHDVERGCLWGQVAQLVRASA